VEYSIPINKLAPSKTSLTGIDNYYHSVMTLLLRNLIGRLRELSSPNQEARIQPRYLAIA